MSYKYTVLAFRCCDLSCELLSSSQSVAASKNMCSNQDFNLKIQQTMPALLPLSYYCILWRSWRDLNPRDISLCPSGFQDRSLQPLEYNSVLKCNMVQDMGVEPIRYFYLGILSPVRLPIPSILQMALWVGLEPTRFSARD